MKKDHSKHLTRALQLIDADTRGLFIDELEESIGETVENAHGKTAVVESALDLLDEEKSRLEQLVVRLLKRELNMIYRVHPQLIGGFKVTVGDWKLDASISSQLESMKEVMGGSR